MKPQKQYSSQDNHNALNQIGRKYPDISQYAKAIALHQNRITRRPIDADWSGIQGISP